MSPELSANAVVEEVEKLSRISMTRTPACQQNSSLTGDIEAGTTDCQTVCRCRSLSVQNVKLVGGCLGADAKRRNRQVRSLLNFPSCRARWVWCKRRCRTISREKSELQGESTILLLHWLGQAWTTVRSTHRAVSYLLFSFSVLVIFHAYCFWWTIVKVFRQGEIRVVHTDLCRPSYNTLALTFDYVCTLCTNFILNKNKCDTKLNPDQCNRCQQWWKATFRYFA